MKTLIVSGACGRMGQRIITIGHENELFKLAGALDHSGHEHIGRDIGELCGLGPLGVTVTDTPEEKADVMIDFSLPEGTVVRAQECEKLGIPLVVGTTGLADVHMDALHKTATKVPVLVAANMSLGINLLLQLIEKAAQALSDDFDIEIVEAHHRFKRDAPSGTALALAQQVAATKEWPYPKCLFHGRQGKLDVRQPQTIGMHAIRGGGIVGEHQVLFASMEETIELRHHAASRDVFAKGALKAAEWLAGREPGMYAMADVLGLTSDEKQL